MTICPARRTTLLPVVSPVSPDYSRCYTARRQQCYRSAITTVIDSPRDGEKNNFVRAHAHTHTHTVELLKLESRTHRIDTGGQHIGRHYASCSLIDAQQLIQYTAIAFARAGRLLVELRLGTFDVLDDYSERDDKRKSKISRSRVRRARETSESPATTKPRAAFVRRALVFLFFVITRAE